MSNLRSSLIVGALLAGGALSASAGGAVSATTPPATTPPASQCGLKGKISSIHTGPSKVVVKNGHTTASIVFNRTGIDESGTDVSFYIAAWGVNQVGSVDGGYSPSCGAGFTASLSSVKLQPNTPYVIYSDVAQDEGPTGTYPNAALAVLAAWAHRLSAPKGYFTTVKG